MTEPGTDQIEEAFRAFEQSLREHLASEAQKSVDGAVERISMRSGPFRISDVEVDVVIRNVRLEAHDAAPGATAARPARKRSASRKRAARAGGTGARGRPPGPVRSALIEVFASASGDMNVQDVRAALEERSVSSTDENLHQQLRRLVKAGELERSGRGRYRRASS